MNIIGIRKDKKTKSKIIVDNKDNPKIIYNGKRLEHNIKINPTKAKQMITGNIPVFQIRFKLIENGKYIEDIETGAQYFVSNIKTLNFIEIFYGNNEEKNLRLFHNNCFEGIFSIAKAGTYLSLEFIGFKDMQEKVTLLEF